jgi:hypothetical protein
MFSMKLEILVLSLVGALLAGFGGGWVVNGWRLSGDVARLEGTVDTQKQSLETYDGANKRCTASVADVKGAVKGIADEADARGKAAAEAMKKAAGEASGHLAAARDALSRPPALPGQECDTAAREATAYAKKRKGAP